MATASVTNTFVNGTTAEAAEVNTNFDDLVTFLNGSIIHVDGSKQFTGLVSGKAGTDPTADDHLARKLFVDNKTWLTSAMNFLETDYTAQFFQQDSTVFEGNEITTSSSTSKFYVLGEIGLCWGSIVFSGSGSSGQSAQMRTPRGFATSRGFVFGTFEFIDVSESPDVIYVGSIRGSSVADDLVSFTAATEGADNTGNLGDAVDVATGDILRFGFAFKTDDAAPATT